MNRQWRRFSIVGLLTAVALATVILFALLVPATEAATVSKTNSTSGAADGNSITRTVALDSADFDAGAGIIDVNIAVTFQKVSDSCATPGGGFPYNKEIYFILHSPTGTPVVLVEDSFNNGGSGTGPTYTSNSDDGGLVTVNFDDAAATLVGGPAPTSGTFRPEQSLSALNGENPVGTWTLTIGDNTASDPLCFDEFTLTVEAEQTPVVDDQTFNVAENSANGTSVGTVIATDPDPAEKLSYEIIAGDPTGVFAIATLSGEITVADESQLDYEAQPSYTLTVRVTDSSGLTDTATITINVDDLNEQPTAVDDSGYNTDEDSLLTIPDNGVLTNDTDPDGDPLTVDSYDSTSANGAALTVNSGGGFDYDPRSATMIQALAAGESVTDTFSYSVVDSGGLTDTAVVTVIVDGLDDPPKALDDTAETPEDTALTVMVLDNDSDAEDGTPSLAQVGLPGNGTATISGTTIVYTPTLNFNGIDTFRYRVTDSTGLTDTATVTVTVTAVNDAPEAIDDSDSTDEDTVLSVAASGVLGNDSDPDGDSLSVTGHDSASTNGATVTVSSDGGFAYDPSGAATLQALAAGEFLTDTFTYTISDPSALTATATVWITVSGVDDAPTAVDDSDTTAEDSPVTIPVLDNDQDAEDVVLSVDSVGAPGNGTATTDGTTVVYTPTLNFNGPDSFTYVVMDSTGLTDTATVTVTVTAVNDAPVAVDDNDSTDEDTLLSVGGSGVLTNDSDPDGDTLTVTGHDGNSAGGALVTVNSDGSFSYDPRAASAIQALAAGDTFTDTFNYTASDSGGLTDNATVSILVSGVDDPPDAVDDTAATTEENAVTVLVLDNDTDAEGGVLTLDSVGTPGNGTATTDGTTVVYTPTLNFNGTDSFTYVVMDSTGLTDTATVTVTVTAVNDPPTDLILSNNSVAENQPAGTPVGTLTTTDADAGDSHIYTLVSGAGDTDNSSFTIVGDELRTQVSFNFEVQSSFSIRVQSSDGNGGTIEEIFTVFVTDLNDPPTAVADNGLTDEDTVRTVADPAAGLLNNDSDEDGDAITVSSADSSSGAGASVNVSSDGTYSYDPTGAATLQALAVGETLTDTFSYTASDGILTTTTTVAIAVTGVNDPPAAADDTTSTPEESPVTLYVLNNDSDIDATDLLSVDTVGVPANGTATSDGTAVVYTPTLEFNGTDVFTYTLSDGNGGTDWATITVTVGAVNDPPVAVDDAGFATDEDSSLTVTGASLLDNDTDPDGDSLSVVVFDGTSNYGAAVVVNGDGTFNYDPADAAALQALAAGETVTDTFEYTAADSGGLSDMAVVSIQVTGINDAPVAADDEADTAEDTPVSIAVLDNDSDPEDGAPALQSVGTPANGDAAIDGTSIVYTPAPNFVGSDQVSYTVLDSGGLTGEATITITVSAVNDSPVAVDDGGYNSDEDTVLTVAAPGLLGNDSDVDGDSLTVLDYDMASTGGAAVEVQSDGRFVYDPTGVPAFQALAVGQTLTDTFGYTATDNGGLTDMAMVTVHITGLNDSPVVQDDNATAGRNETLTLNVLDNDMDPDGDTLIVDAVGVPTGGSATTDGIVVSYTPDADFSGTDVFTYTVSDGNGESASATITVDVAGDSQIFLPVVGKMMVEAPDLVIHAVRGSSDTIEVVIQNVGTVPTLDSFWVDFYIDPDPVPVYVNDLWQDVADEGIVWGVDVSLAPGDSLTLTYSTAPNAPNVYFAPDFSLYTGSLPAGTPIYAQVDSAHMDSSFGGVLESHEINGATYNNVSAMATAVAGFQPSSARSEHHPAARTGLPARR